MRGCSAGRTAAYPDRISLEAQGTTFDRVHGAVRSVANIMEELRPDGTAAGAGGVVQTVGVEAVRAQQHRALRQHRRRLPDSAPRFVGAALRAARLRSTPASAPAASVGGGRCSWDLRYTGSRTLTLTITR